MTDRIDAMLSSPRVLDWVINGVPVYIYERPQAGAVGWTRYYSSTHDYARFRLEPMMVIRVRPPMPEFIGPWNPEYDPAVLARLAILNDPPNKGRSDTGTPWARIKGCFGRRIGNLAQQ